MARPVSQADAFQGARGFQTGVPRFMPVKQREDDVIEGIGIMNVMLVSVSERTREIGVRMAVGARQRDVVFQFLLEAILISAVGGLLGVATGILSIPLAASFNQGLAVLNPVHIPLAFGVALLTGLAFGLYPALRAARLDPIEALRYE